jgi:hypothetical protein
MFTAGGDGSLPQGLLDHSIFCLGNNSKIFEDYTALISFASARRESNICIMPDSSIFVEECSNSLVELVIESFDLLFDIVICSYLFCSINYIIKNIKSTRPFRITIEQCAILHFLTLKGFSLAVI